MQQDMNQQPLPEERDTRRNAVPDLDSRAVTFAVTTLSYDRLEALRKFVRSASADEIAIIRETYGDQPEVLRAIGLELGASS